MVLTEGQTPLERVLKRNYEYYSDRIRHVRSVRTDRIRDKRGVISINELQCTKLLSSLYPTEFDLVRTEMTQWIQNCDIITPSLTAAKFLWCCRINKIPTMFNEVSKDFGISAKKVTQTMSKIDYVPALGTAEYVDRLSKQLGLCDFVRDTAIDLVSENIGGSSPTIRACCAIIKAIKKHGLKIKTSDIASTLEVTPAGIQLAIDGLCFT